ncbi:MAG: ABC transporter permease [Bacteroidota bacterium]
MLKHYVLAGLRNLWKDRFYSAINILGLGLGMGCCLLILVHVRNELTFDDFHPEAEHTYRVAMHALVQDAETDYPMIGFPWSEMFREEIPQVETATHLNNPPGIHVIRGIERFEEEQFFITDAEFPKVFRLRLLTGSAKTALSQPNQVLLTPEKAIKYFGTTDAVDRTLTIDFGGDEIELQVAGIMEPFPYASHFHPDFLTSEETMVQVFPGGRDHPFFQGLGFNAFYTYVKTREPEALSEPLAAMYDSKVNEGTKSFMKGLFLQPLTDIHLTSSLIGELEPNGNELYVYVFIFVALLTLVISCINFVNLSTARAANRSKEVGLRKVVGAFRKDLIRQFLSESVVVATLAMVLALGLMYLMRGLLEQISGVYIPFSLFQDGFIWLTLSLITASVGLLAGSYPAFFLSAFEPSKVLRGRLRSGAKGSWLRKGLVIFQFTISTALLIGTGILYQQLTYINTMDMGFERDMRVVIPVQIGNQDNQRVLAVERLKQRFDQQPQVVQTAAMQIIPGQPRGLTQVQVDGQPSDKVHMPVTMGVDFAYVETMGLRVLKGRAFDQSYGTDSTQAVMINEAAIRQMDLPKDPIGLEITYVQGNGAAQAGDQVDKVRVIGVYQDMHFEPIYREIHPMLLRIQPQGYQNLVVHIEPENARETLAAMEKDWQAVIPERAFAYTFLDEELAEIYQNEDRLGNMVLFFAGLAILIACLGLFALSAFTTQQRRKEISIRKVLGASVSGIVGLLSKEFVLLVLVAFPLAGLLAWWATSIWLESFFYRAEISAMVYLGAAVVSLLIAFLTVSFQSYRAAVANPAENLHRD